MLLGTSLVDDLGERNQAVITHDPEATIKHDAVGLAAGPPPFSAVTETTGKFVRGAG